MRVLFASLRFGVIGIVLFGIFVCTAYALTSRRLDEARRARREDDYARAENFLASCWPLPGYSEAFEIESQLLAVQQGDLHDEKHWQSRALRDSAQRPLILEALAKGCLAAFQWADALSHAESILSKQPAEATALWLRGRALVEMQQESQALQDFEDALKSAPHSIAIARSHADLLHKLGYVQSAIEQYRRLNQMRPNDPKLLLALAHCYQEQSLQDAALNIVDHLLDASEPSVEVLVERGRLALHAGELEAAEQWLRRAVAKAPENTDANHVLRLSLQAQKKVDAALDRNIEQHELRQAELKQQLAKHGHDPEVLTNVGHWMMRTGAHDEVLGWLYSALQRDANFQPAHQLLAEYFYENGQPLRAAQHARRAGLKLEKGPRSTHSSSTVANLSQWFESHDLATAIQGEATTEEVHRLCAACHAYPDPQTMPRSTWRKEVKQGYDFLRHSSLVGQQPAFERVVAYYEKRAPAALPPIEQPKSSAKPPVNFQLRGTGYMPRLPPSPAVTNATLARMGDANNQQLLLCETRQDALMLLHPYDTSPGGTIIPQVPSPCHTTACDLDRDGHSDLLVASIGSFFPTDDKLGQVLWLRGKANGQFDSIQLLAGVGRVTDIQVADFGGDGKLDLIVAVYGWRSTGEILYLENDTSDWAHPKFKKHVVDSRHGTVHVPVADINRDDHLDFVALISQEHESVVAYLNQGNGTFESKLLFAAPNPSYGCSGIELVDMDHDNDLDVLLSNGDILDPPYLLKPYHGVQWLENSGTYPFVHHHVGAMYGAVRAVAADFDNDGDQDVAAVSFLPALHFPEREKLQLPSVALFEQTAGARFVMHVLETGTCDHFSCAAGDWDSDGQVDLAVTNFSWNGSKPMRDAAMLWRNIGK